MGSVSSELAGQNVSMPEGHTIHRAARSQNYTHILFDLDHTLFDTEASLKLAFTDAMARVGVDPTGHYPTFQTINSRLWKQVEAGTITPDAVHTRRFEELTELLHLDGDPAAMAEGFAGGMQAHGELYPGTFETLELLKPTLTMALITNGISHIQRGRIERLEIAHFFESITVSSEIGWAKPDPEIFRATLDSIGNPPLESVLMVGDSLSADITGGNSFGLHTCWYNPNQLVSSVQISPTYVVSSLSEIVDLVAP